MTTAFNGIDDVRVIRAPFATSRHGARILADPDSPINAPRFMPVPGHAPGPFYAPVAHLVAPDPTTLERAANALFGPGYWEPATLADDPATPCAAPIGPENCPFKAAGKPSDGPRRCAALLEKAGLHSAYATSCGAIASTEQ